MLVHTQSALVMCQAVNNYIVGDFLVARVLSSFSGPCSYLFLMDVWTVYSSRCSMSLYYNRLHLQKLHVGGTRFSFPTLVLG